MNSVLQNWVMELPLMMQGVLLTSMRGPDGVAKDHRSKPIVHALRRLILISGVDGRTLNLEEEGGGSFAPPVPNLDLHMLGFIECMDELPHHYIMHTIHSAEIISFAHPDITVRHMWKWFYESCCHDMHMKPELVNEMNNRLRNRWEK